MKRPGKGLLVLWLVGGFLLAAGVVASAMEPGGAAPEPTAAAAAAANPATPSVEQSPSPADPRAVPTQARTDTLDLDSINASDGVAGGVGGATGVGGAAPPLGTLPGAGVQAPDLSPGSRSLDTPLPVRLRSLLGLLLLAGLAWGMSIDRSNVPWRVVLWGIALQIIFALFILKTPVGAQIFDAVNTVVVALLGFTVEGARFVFGDLVFNSVPVGTGRPGNAPMEPAPELVARTGAFFAFNVLPTIIFFSSLMTVLYHIGIMQVVVKGAAWVMQRTMRTSGAETLSAAGNIFVGQTEAPLLIKPFVERMTLSELNAVMVGGFATVAGGVLAAYVGMLVAYFPDIAGHLMAASVMSAPAALVVAKLMVPESGEPVTGNSLHIEVDKPDVNVIDAAARGASEGLHLALNVAAMLMAFLAMVYLLNALLGWGGGLVGIEGLTMERILGWVLAPVAWMMGVEWAEAPIVASLMGVKTVLNEFVAYLQLSTVLAEGQLSPRSVVIATYALSGFANFSSIAIQLGGIGGIAPSRRHDLSRLGFRAMIGGSIAAFMTACVAGMLV